MKNPSEGNGPDGISRVEEFTPQRAASILASSNGKNYRPLMERHARFLSRSIARGEFTVNGESIKFNTAGDLVDGQHRLRACVIANRPFRSYVVYGVDDVINIDTGSRRKLDDLLRAEGYEHVAHLAGALSWIWKEFNGGWMHHHNRITPRLETLRLAQEFPDVIFWCKTIHTRVSRDIGHHAILIAFCFFAAKKDRDLALWFVERVGDGAGLTVGDPILALRKRIAADRVASKHMSAKSIMALLITAWNLLRRGKTCSFLAWREGGLYPQPFPTIA